MPCTLDLCRRTCPPNRRAIPSPLDPCPGHALPFGVEVGATPLPSRVDGNLESTEAPPTKGPLPGSPCPLTKFSLQTAQFHMLKFPVTTWVDLFHLRGKQNKTKHGGGFLSQEEGSPIMGFGVCGPGILGRFCSQRALGRQAPRWKSLSHWQVGTGAGGQGGAAATATGSCRGNRGPSSSLRSLAGQGRGGGAGGRGPGLGRRHFPASRTRCGARFR